jgi:hypothetical protein
MTPKEKAKQLVDKYNTHELLYWHLTLFQAKQCALIAIDEILQHCYEVMKPFWQEVKQEISLL